MWRTLGFFKYLLQCQVLFQRSRWCWVEIGMHMHILDRPNKHCTKKMIGFFLTIKCQEELFLILLTWSLHYIPCSLFYKVSNTKWVNVVVHMQIHVRKDWLDWWQDALWINENKAIWRIWFHQIMFLSDMSTMLESPCAEKKKY